MKMSFHLHVLRSGIITILTIVFVIGTFGSTTLKQDLEKDKLVKKINNLDLNDVIKDAQNYLEFMKNGSIADDRSLHVDNLNPATMAGSVYMGDSLSSMVEFLQLGKVAYEVEHSMYGGATCTFCKAAFMFLQYYLDGGRDIQDFEDDLKMLCSGIGMGIGGVTYTVCSGLVDMYSKDMVTVVKSTKQSPEQICGFMFSEACKNKYNPFHEWKSLVPPGKPSHRVPVPSGKPSGSPLTVLHISDTHFDHLYKEGSNAVCGEPMCCRESSGLVEKVEDKAGYWGDFRKCDTPLRTIEAMYKHIAATHPNLDLIYWTGDLPAHDIWNQTREGNKEIVRATALQLQKFFPEVPVFPALGNHESVLPTPHSAAP